MLPDEVSDKFEIHGEAFKDKLSVTKPRCSRWRKSDEVNLSNQEELEKSDKVFMHEDEKYVVEAESGCHVVLVATLNFRVFRSFAH